MSELKTKQDKLCWEWSEDLNSIEILWILETEDGKFYQKKKKINVSKTKQW